MKVIWLTIFVLACLWDSTCSQPVRRPWEYGFSDQYRSENNLGHYAFGYNEDHLSGGSFRRETSDQFGNKVGSYGLRISDGRVRIVNYVADKNGFRADVISNEPGMSSQKQNPYLSLTKKSVYGVLVPGFRFSGEAPHVTFDDGSTGGQLQLVHEEPQFGQGTTYTDDRINVSEDRINDVTEFDHSQDTDSEAHSNYSKTEPGFDLVDNPSDIQATQAATKESYESLDEDQSKQPIETQESDVTEMRESQTLATESSVEAQKTEKTPEDRADDKVATASAK